MTKGFDVSEIKALLARSQEIIDRVENPGVDFKSPDKVFRSVTFLCDMMFNAPIEDILHDFPDKPCLQLEVGVADPNLVVMHGHNSGVMCASSHYCHIHTFRPSAVHSPAFRKSFNHKWGYK